MLSFSKRQVWHNQIGERCDINEDELKKILMDE